MRVVLWLAMAAGTATAQPAPIPDHGSVVGSVMAIARVYGDQNVETRAGLDLGGAVRIPGTLLALTADVAYGRRGISTFFRATGGLELAGPCIGPLFVDGYAGYQDDDLKNVEGVPNAASPSFVGPLIGGRAGIELGHSAVRFRTAVVFEEFRREDFSAPTPVWLASLGAMVGVAYHL